MEKFFESVFTLENITLFLSIFGTIGTLFSFVNTLLINRKNLKIRIDRLYYIKDLQTLFVSCIFENRSRLPISVTSVSLKINSEIIKPEEYPRMVNKYAYRENNVIIDRKLMYNLQTPVDISQLSAVHGDILFAIPQATIEKLSTPMFLQVYSTRRGVQQIELSRKQIDNLK